MTTNTIPGMNTLSTNSNAPTNLLGSERESRINWGFFVPMIVGGILTVFVANFIWKYDGSVPFVDQRPPVVLPTSPSGSALGVITETPTVAVFGFATETPTVEVVFRDKEPEIVYIEVTSTPTPEPIIEVRYEQIQVPVEVTVVVEVTPAPLPTITAIPLASGVVQICASVEGATALYIGGAGVVSGECKKFSFGVGQTSIQVQVNR